VVELHLSDGNRTLKDIVRELEERTGHKKHFAWVSKVLSEYYSSIGTRASREKLTPRRKTMRLQFRRTDDMLSYARAQGFKEEGDDPEHIIFDAMTFLEGMGYKTVLQN
jgi:hypothetical protein